MLQAALERLQKLLRGERGKGSDAPLGEDSHNRIEELKRLRDSSLSTKSGRQNLLTRTRTGGNSLLKRRKSEQRARMHWLDGDQAYSSQGMVQSIDANQQFQRTVGQQTAVWIEFNKILIRRPIV
jgi:hypothetical protein